MKTLMKYELKKILARKAVWVCLAISFVLILVTMSASLVGSYYVDGEYIGSNYEMFQMDKAYQQALDGRLIDESLLQEMQAAYSKVPLEAERYSLTEEYQKYARPYSAIYNYVRQTTGLSGMKVLNLAADTETLHAKRLEYREKRWEEYLLSEAEKEFWRQQELKIENPVTFRYAEGYSVLISAVYTVGLLAIFMVAVCLAGVFPQEHVRRTDQLILSSRCGRREIFGAKFCAGILFAFLMTLVFAIISFAAAFLLYGADGFDAAFQLIYAGSSCPISVGQAALIAYLMVIFAGLFTAALVMLLSEVLRSNVGALAIIIGMIMLPMLFMVPEEYRVLGQLWSYLPSDFVAVWSMFSPCTVLIFGKAFQAWQVVPVLYTTLGVLFAFGTKRSFVNYQVSGR